MKSTITALALVLLASCAGCAQRQPVQSSTSAAAAAPESVTPGPDPDFLRQYAETNRFRLGKPVNIRFPRGGATALFLRSGPRSFTQDLYELDLTTGRERLALSAEDLLGGGEEHLTPEELARRERMRLASRGVTAYSVSEDGQRLLIPLSGRLFVVDTGDWSVREVPSDAGFPLDARMSRDGARIACVRNGDLYVIDAASGAETRLTHDAGDSVTNGLAEFVAQEEMDRDHGYWWSPDGDALAYARVDTAGMERFHIADPFRPEVPAQDWPYPRAGEKNAQVRLGVIPSQGGDTVWVDWDQEQYPYLATVKWPKSGPMCIVVQNRRQTEELLLEVDPTSGSTRTLLVERDPDWINLFQSTPHWLEDGSGFLWITERNAHIELELRAPSGDHIRTLAGADIGLIDLLGVDDDAAVAFVSASTNPTQKQIWTVPLNEQSARPTPLTSEPGVHALSLAHDGAAFVLHSTAISGRESWTVTRKGDDAAVSIQSVAESPNAEPNLELVTLHTGDRDLHAAIIRPRGFRWSATYPVIASVYGGPHSQVVTSARSAYRLHQWLADHGYIVVSIDGRGTPGRGRDWERAIKGDLIGPAMEDLVSGLHALGQRFPELDTSRMGVFGWSFGGYFSAMATMRHPELFKAGVAGAPVCDWRDYDTHYTERYLGLPDSDQSAYDVSNVLTYAANLQAPLLIIHGTADDNVYLVHGLKMADALLHAGKPFEFLPLPGHTHMVRDPEVVERMYARIVSFFDRAIK